ncbi:MAG TPA: chitobiase/beta-hexosaminidase C-terminal domain-containing protein [Candidatus Diapherotrites archaeon]|nr:chitobiase/beta-hexosaminidase C-terminal domain-containing protein [Candidatus Diapherotrites archaeon]
MKKSTLKNKNKKKGQGSIETLLLFGGAVLLAAIVIAIIVGIGSSSKQSTEKSASSAITMSKTVIPAVLHSVTCVDRDCDVLFQSFSDGNNELVIDDDVEHRKEIKNNRVKLDNQLGIGTHSAYILTTLDGGSAKSNTYRWDVSSMIPPSGTGKVATPIATPVGGKYTKPQAVTLKTKTQGTTIYYTTDGSNPSTSSIRYQTPIQISSTTTLKAIACKDGMTDSEILTENYRIITPTHIELTFDPQHQTFVQMGGRITITTEPSTDEIWYTLDGSNPTIKTSSKYDGGIRIDNNFTRIKAIAYGNNEINSGVQKAEYTVEGYVADPIAEPTSGTVSIDAKLALSTTTPDAEIYYTTDGSKPTTSSNRYENPVGFNDLGCTKNPCQIKAIAFFKESNSNVVTFDYTINDSSVITPTADPTYFNFEDSIDVVLNTETESADIYYTLDESTPTANSQKYISKINITETTTIKAIAIWKNISSGVLTVTYERSQPSNSEGAP